MLDIKNLIEEAADMEEGEEKAEAQKKRPTWNPRPYFSCSESASAF